MRILILGGSGMLGHTLHYHLSEKHEVTSTTRRALADLPVDPSPFFARGGVRERTDATDVTQLAALLAEIRPDAVVNAIGIIKQSEDASDPIQSIRVNALFPHLAARASAEAGSRFVHVSTDCVFSGDKGDYTEDDVSDARDLYGRTKYLGEVASPGALTVRTSIIGRELDGFAGLIEWFLHQRGTVRGYTRAIYTGVTTKEFARQIETVLTDHPTMSGLYQLAADKITKYALLDMVRARLPLTDIELVQDDGFICDRSLAGDKWRAAIGRDVSTWQAMIDELAADHDMYRRRAK